MRYNPKARFLPIVILPAIMPALLLPVLVSIHAPDYVMGGAMGFFIGIAIVGFAWMLRSNHRRSTDN